MAQEPRVVLSAANIEAIYKHCLLEEGEFPEIPKQFTLGVGVITDSHFDPNRIFVLRNSIMGMLSDLPDVFHNGNGGRFLQATKDRRGHLWIKETLILDKLFQMGQYFLAVRYEMRDGNVERIYIHTDYDPDKTIGLEQITLKT